MEINNFILRKPLHSDLDDLFLVKNNKKTSKLLGGNTPEYSHQDIINWIDYHNSLDNEELFVIFDKVKCKVIGHVGLYKIDKLKKCAEFAILIGNDDYIGKGVGKQITRIIIDYGFKELNLDRISLSLLDANIPAFILYKKLGFIEEGRQKEAIWKNNRYYDNILMAILRRNYECP